MISSHWASNVESGGVFLMMGPASNTMVWTGLGGDDAGSAIVFETSRTRRKRKNVSDYDQVVEGHEERAREASVMRKGNFSWSWSVRSYRLSYQCASSLVYIVQGFFYLFLFEMKTGKHICLKVLIKCLTVIIVQMICVFRPCHESCGSRGLMLLKIAARSSLSAVAHYG